MKVTCPLLVKHLVMGSQCVSGPKTFVYGPILCYRSSQKSGNRGALKSTFCWTLKDQVRECEESIMYINLYISIYVSIFGDNEESSLARDMFDSELIITKMSNID